MARIALFDLGGVLLDWEPARMYRQLMPADEAARFCAEICTWEWHCRHDQGASMADNAAQLIAQHPDKADLIHAWSSRWLDMFHGEITGSVRLVETLKARGVPLFALTNFPADKWDETANAFPILKTFEDVIISGVEKVAKPDRRIYEIALSRMGEPSPADILFIDDRLENIEAAQALGMQGHHFKNPTDLETALKAEGLL